jgi:hypothetical protein
MFQHQTSGRIESLRTLRVGIAGLALAMAVAFVGGALIVGFMTIEYLREGALVAQQVAAPVAPPAQQPQGRSVGDFGAPLPGSGTASSAAAALGRAARFPLEADEAALRAAAAAQTRTVAQPPTLNVQDFGAPTAAGHDIEAHPSPHGPFGNPQDFGAPPPGP